MADHNLRPTLIASINRQCRLAGLTAANPGGAPRRRERGGYRVPPTESSLSQEGNFRDFGARRVHVLSKAQLPKVLVGPGVPSPKSRPPGCRAGHAGHESFPLVLPGPYLLASTRSWR